MAKLEHYTTPVGRLVQGNVWEPQTQGFDGSELRTKSGNPKVQYYMGLAIPKDNPLVNNFMDYIKGVAARAFPNGEYQREGFAWKWMDGDKEEYSDNDGFKGNWVFKLVTGFKPKIYAKGAESQIVDPSAVKRGDYIRACINVKGNSQTKNNWGVYLNVLLLEFIAYGEEIISAVPDARKAFSTPYDGPLPPGASDYPVDNSPGIAPPVTPATVNTSPGIAPPVTPPPPAPDYLKPEKTMTAKAGGMPYEKWIAGGWNDKQLIENGYMVA